MKTWFMLPFFVISVSALIIEHKAYIIQHDRKDEQLLTKNHVPKDRQVITFIGGSNSNVNESINASVNVCLTKGCVKIAAFLINYMNDTEDPCHDFYNFACGQYIARTNIPDEESLSSIFTDMDKNLEAKMRLVFEQDATINDSNTTIKIKKLYKSCMDTKFIEKDGLRPLRNILLKLGGWPVVKGNSWTKSGLSTMETLYMLNKIGYSVPLISFGVEPDVVNSSRRIIVLDQTSLIMEREYLIKGIDDTDIKSYLEYATSAASLLGANPTTVEKEMKDMILFEIQLANISSPREERRNFTKLLNMMNILELQENIPEIPWFEFIKNLMPSFIEVELNEIIMVPEEGYFRNLVKLLRDTSERTITNYLLWNVVQESVPYLTEDIRKLHFEQMRKLYGIKTKVPRWKKCVNLVKDSMSIGVGNLYVINYFDEEAKDKIETMVQYLRNSFDQMLQSVDWMDETTKGKGLEKSKAIQNHIAYPMELLMESKIEEYHKNYTLNGTSLLKNMLQMSVVSKDYSRGLLRKDVDKSDWKAQAAVAEVNAYYYSLENSIKFPAGILQEVMFDPNFPNYINFGGIGYAIGHEITHGFDDQGSQFDGDGNLKNWWEPATAEKYLMKTKCFIDQYSNYVVPENGLKLNGLNSQGEDVADNGGIKDAYLAYQQWVKDNGAEPSLPGLSYDANQLFWISMGQKHCSKSRPEALKKQVMTGSHTPSRFRVIGPIRNSPDFAKDFRCPLGSPMNPKEKCTVW